MLSLLLLFSIVNQQIKCQIQQLYENFNKLKINDWNYWDDWKCTNQHQPEVYNCNSGMDLIMVDRGCFEITHQIQNILPHYQVQLYIDIYCYGGLDPSDNLAIIIDQDNKWQTGTEFRPSEFKPLGETHQCTNYLDAKNYQMRKTAYLVIPHTTETLKIQLKSTISGDFLEESYLFRNLQILYNKCYKTCKTCEQEQKDKCNSCYDNIALISKTCMSCQDQINLTFLLIPQGCVVQCEDEYDYDLEKVCYKNEKLKNYDNSKLTKSQEGYQVFGQLDKSTILLRITVTIEIMDKNVVNVVINRVKTASISKYRIRSKPGSKSNYLRRINNEIMFEVNKPISEDTFTIEIVKYQHLSTIPTIKIQYLVCALDCYVCQTKNTCKVCKDNYYLHNGLCFTNCPDYTKQQDHNCVIPNDNVAQQVDQQEVFLVKEFYDLSTSKERIDELFTKVNSVSSTNNQHNFQKGEDIYFSYFQNKRIFGGPYVWVNAQFKFHLVLENIEQFVYVKFEIILGDEEIHRNQFHYTINTQTKKTIRINQNLDLQEDQNWKNDYKTDIIQVREKIEYQNNDNKELNILFDCVNNYNQAFCGIKNLFISVLKPIQDDIDLFEQDDKNDNQDDSEGIFNISICGDGITSVDEDCDDGNLIPFDGCFNCKYSCEQLCQFCVKDECLFMLELPSSQNLSNLLDMSDISFILQEYQLNNCEIVIKGVCLQCKNGYYANLINNLCETICGDQIIQGQEQCDDGNLNNYDGCSDCQLIYYENCDMQETCAICYYGKCLQCYNGFTLESDRCISICGDGLINNKEEECDNPIEEGCDNCQIQKGYICHGPSQSICKTCGVYCKDCQSINQSELICHDCISGYYPVLNNCLQCDNNCITCKGQSNQCTSCYRYDCELCESIPGYYTDFQNQICITQCGDGIIAQEQEDCDDGNLEDGDGCDSECRIELSENFINKLQLWQQNGNGIYDLYLKNSEYKLVLNCLDPLIIIDGMQTNDFSYNISILLPKLQFINKVF